MTKKFYWCRKCQIDIEAGSWYDHKKLHLQTENSDAHNRKQYVGGSSVNRPHRNIDDENYLVCLEHQRKVPISDNQFCVKRIVKGADGIERIAYCGRFFCGSPTDFDLSLMCPRQKALIRTPFLNRVIRKSYLKELVNPKPDKETGMTLKPEIEHNGVRYPIIGNKVEIEGIKVSLKL